MVIVGFQAQGTLGRRLLDGDKRVRIFGEEIAVKAHIHEITGLSAHADQAQLLAWASHFKPPRLTILIHGELKAALALERLLEEKLHFKVVVGGTQRDLRPRRGAGPRPISLDADLDVSEVLMRAMLLEAAKRAAPVGGGALSRSRVPARCGSRCRRAASAAPTCTSSTGSCRRTSCR